MIGTAPHAALTNVPGWETPGEQDYLYQLAVDVPENGAIVEIGGEFGMSASLFCKGASPSVSITTVDIFPADMLDKHQSNLAEAGLAGRSQQIRGDSHLASTLKKAPKELDLIFIDGDHSMKGALLDLELWSVLVKVGGVVTVHDCACASNLNPHYIHYDVTRAVNTWFTANGRNWELVNMVDSLMIFRRVL